MAINKIEKEVLYKQKIKEGKSSDEAHYDIRRDELFDRSLNKLNKEIDKLKKQLDLKNKIILEQKIRINKKSNINFKQRFKEDKLKEEKNRKHGNLATTRELWRILDYLESDKKNMNEITKAVGFIDRKRRDNAFSFLLKTNLIKQENNKFYIDTKK